MTIPLLLDIPEAFETERLLIRVPRAGDGPAANVAVLESLESLRAWMPWAKEAPSVEDSETYARRSRAKFLTREEIQLWLIHKASGLFLGASGFNRPDWDVPKFEVGYWCRRQFAGQGYITEAVEAILRFGFQILKARRLEVRCDSLNQRSLRVAERAGMRREAELKNYRLGLDGTLRNELIFALTDEDWQSLPQAATAVRIVR
jgi:RimJ/RimL family protein N-acetyltransferase